MYYGLLESLGELVRVLQYELLFQVTYLEHLLPLLNSFHLLIDESLTLFYELNQMELPLHVDVFLNQHVHHTLYLIQIEPLLFQLDPQLIFLQKI